MSALKKSCQYITVFFIKALTLKHFDAEGSTVYSIGQAPRALLAKSWQIFCGAAVRLWLAHSFIITTKTTTTTTSQHFLSFNSLFKDNYIYLSLSPPSPPSSSR